MQRYSYTMVFTEADLVRFERALRVGFKPSYDRDLQELHARFAHALEELKADKEWEPRFWLPATPA